MHDGCSASFEDGKQVVDKLRGMGFSNQPLPMSFDLPCQNCGKAFTMETFEDRCPDCGAVAGVTPCHAFDPDNVRFAGIGY